MDISGKVLIFNKMGNIMAKIKQINLKKIIYFDEESANDLILLVNGGAAAHTKKDSSSFQGSATTGAQAKAGHSFNLFDFLKSSFQADINGSIGASREKLITQIITNTTLTDFLNLDARSTGVEVFKNKIAYPHKDSLSYIKLLTPYMQMTDEQIKAGEFNINTSKMDEVLENAKGYYEMLIGNPAEEERKILRFNIKAFKNNYGLSELPKMCLDYYAVKVGKMSINKLNINMEFETTTTPLDGVKMSKGVENEDLELEVYDVLLAGVGND